MFPRISIVTPCFNMVEYIEKTILSVVNQDYPNLEYIVIDGGSTDGSLAVIKKYEKYLTYFISEPDEGMYHGIKKGFNKSTGEIMGWINSDDILHPNSLFVLAKCFSNMDVNWVQGLNTIINNEGFVIATSKAYNTNKFNFLSFDYLINNQLRPFGTLQQESTYWRRKLWDKSGGLDLTYKYAGDFALWISFFRHDQLFIVDSLIGAFRVRPNQLSAERIDEYIEETKLCIKSELAQLNPLDRKKFRKIVFYKKIKRIPFVRQLLIKLDKDCSRFINI